MHRRPAAARPLPGATGVDGDVDLVNRCRNGARVQDVIDQLAAFDAADDRFDLALIVAGGHDILKATEPARLGDQAERLLERLERIADRAVWVGCADIGAAPIFLPPLSWWFRWRTRRVTGLIGRCAERRGVDFVDFSRGRHDRLIRRRRADFFAADGIHPTAKAYRYCFDVLRERPAVRWLQTLPAAPVPVPVPMRAAG